MPWCVDVRRIGMCSLDVRGTAQPSCIDIIVVCNGHIPFTCSSGAYFQLWWVKELLCPRYSQLSWHGITSWALLTWNHVMSFVDMESRHEFLDMESRHELSWHGITSWALLTWNHVISVISPLMYCTLLSLLMGTKVHICWLVNFWCHSWKELWE